MKKKTNIKKYLFVTLMVLAALFVKLTSVNAAANNITIYSTKHQSGDNPFNVARAFNELTANGSYVYCLDYKLTAPNGISYTLNTNGNLVTDAGVKYIVSSGMDDKTTNDFFITQVALWIYMNDKGLMTDSSYNTIKLFRDAVYSSSNNTNSTAVAIRNLVSAAKAAKAEEDPYITITTNESDVKFTKQGNNYVSNLIKVETSADEYRIDFMYAPSGTTYQKTNDGFYIIVPASSLSEQGTYFRVILAAIDEVTKVYQYNPPSSNYQPVALATTDKVSVSTMLKNVYVIPEKEPEPTPEPTPEPEPEPEIDNIISIIKRDEDTNKPLAGAVLVLKDSEGNIIDKWTTTEEAHVIKDLEVGTYTITEVSAPAGYEINKESVTFEVKSNTTSKEISFYNDKKDEEVVIEVPVDKTGTKENIMVSIAGIGLVAAGAMLIFKKNKEHAK